MPNLIAALFLIGIAFFGGRFLVRRRNRPEVKLLRDFKKLQNSILKSIGSENKLEAQKLLSSCDLHLQALLTAREQQLVLEDMRKSASELTGVYTPSAPEIVNDLPTKLSDFLVA